MDSPEKRIYTFLLPANERSYPLLRWFCRSVTDFHPWFSLSHCSVCTRSDCGVSSMVLVFDLSSKLALIFLDAEPSKHAESGAYLLVAKSWVLSVYWSEEFRDNFACAISESWKRLPSFGQVRDRLWVIRRHLSGWPVRLSSRRPSLGDSAIWSPFRKLLFTCLRLSLSFFFILFSNLKFAHIFSPNPPTFPRTVSCSV